MRDPFSGVTPEVYAGLSDRVILNVYLAERDDDGKLVTEGSSATRAANAERAQRIRDAGRQLPKLADLGVPEEALAWASRRLATKWVAMYWQFWLARGLTREQVFERWKKQHGKQRRTDHGPVADAPSAAAPAAQKKRRRIGRRQGAD